MYETAKRIISRTSNRAFVGAPVCKSCFHPGICERRLTSLLGRDPDYNDVAIKITMDVILTANIVNLFPQFLKPYVIRERKHNTETED